MSKEKKYQIGKEWKSGFETGLFDVLTKVYIHLLRFFLNWCHYKKFFRKLLELIKFNYRT